MSQIIAGVGELGRDTRGAAGTVGERAMERIRSEADQALTRLREAIAEVRRTEGPMGGRSAGQG